MTTPHQILVASFEGVLFVQAAAGKGLTGKELSDEDISKLNTSIDWSTIGRVFHGIHSGHIAADPAGWSAGEQKCFVVVNLIARDSDLQPGRCKVPEDILAAIAEKLSPGCDVDDWECVETDVVASNTEAEPSLYGVRLPWAFNGRMDDEEGTYYTVVPATSEEQAILVAATEMADSGRKGFSDRAEWRKFVRSRSIGQIDVTNLVDRVRSDLASLFAASAPRSARLEELRNEIMALFEQERPAAERQRGG